MNNINIIKCNSFNDLLSLPIGTNEVKVNFEWNALTDHQLTLLSKKNLGIQIISFGVNAKLREFRGIEKFPELKQIKAFGQHRLTNMSSLCSLPKLRDLSISAAWQLDLKPLMELVKLEKMFLEGPTKGYRLLNNLVNLQHLEIEGLKMRDLKNISNLIHLKSLSARGISLKSLNGLPGSALIKEINFSQTSINNIENLCQLDTIEIVWLCNCKHLNDISILASLPRLRELYINDNQHIIDLLPLSDSPTLSTIYFYGTKVTPESFSSLARMPALEKCECTLFGDPEEPDVQEIARLLPNCQLRISQPNGEIFCR